MTSMSETHMQELVGASCLRLWVCYLILVLRETDSTFLTFLKLTARIVLLCRVQILQICYTQALTLIIAEARSQRCLFREAMMT